MPLFDKFWKSNANFDQLHHITSAWHREFSHTHITYSCKRSAVLTNKVQRDWYHSTVTSFFASTLRHIEAAVGLPGVADICCLSMMTRCTHSVQHPQLTLDSRFVSVMDKRMEQGLTSHQIHYSSYYVYVYLVKLIYFIFFLWCYRLWWNKDEYILGTGFYASNDLTNSVKALKEDRVLRIRLQSHQIHPTTLTIIQQLYSIKQNHTKYRDKRK